MAAAARAGTRGRPRVGSRSGVVTPLTHLPPLTLPSCHRSLIPFVHSLSPEATTRSGRRAPTGMHRRQALEGEHRLHPLRVNGGCPIPMLNRFSCGRVRFIVDCILHTFGSRFGFDLGPIESIRLGIRRFSHTWGTNFTSTGLNKPYMDSSTLRI